MSSAGVWAGMVTLTQEALQTPSKERGPRSELVEEGVRQQDYSWWYVPFRLSTGSPSEMGH